MGNIITSSLSTFSIARSREISPNWNQIVLCVIFLFQVSFYFSWVSNNVHASETKLNTNQTNRNFVKRWWSEQAEMFNGSNGNCCCDPQHRFTDRNIEWDLIQFNIFYTHKTVKINGAPTLNTNQKKNNRIKTKNENALTMNGLDKA